MALPLSPYFDIAIIAQNSESEKDKALKELEKLKSERDIYDSQIDSLMEEAYATANRLREIELQIQKADSKIAEIEQETKAKKEKIRSLYLQKKMLLGDLYILTDNNLMFLTSLLNTQHFSELITGKDEQSIILEEKIKEVAFVESCMEDLKDDIVKLGLDKKSYQDQKINLQGKAQEILIKLAAAQKSLSGTDLRASALEQYLLSLGKIESKNKRDFVSWNKASGETYTFVGGGTEHGLGMSQYGVLGAVQHGLSYVDSLKHYYSNSKVEAAPQANTDIKVGIVLGGTGGRINVLGGNARVWDRIIFAGGSIEITPGDVRLYKNNGDLLENRAVGGNVEIYPENPTTSLEVTYKPSFFNRYRGIIRTANVSGSIKTINQVNIEEYLKGVVPGEMPSGWPVEALKAQAVAARSYAVRQLKPGSLYDVDDTTRYQVYVGTGYGPTSSVNQAVDQTKGQIVIYGSEIVPAYYHSTSGGWTENNENIWGGAPRPYLRGVASNWEEASPWWSWQTKTFIRPELESIFNSRPETMIGTLKSIEILNRGVSGRVLAVRIEGSAFAKIVSGATFKSILNTGMTNSDPLRCTLFGVKN